MKKVFSDLAHRPHRAMISGRKAINKQTQKRPGSQNFILSTEAAKPNRALESLALRSQSSELRKQGVDCGQDASMNAYTHARTHTWQPLRGNSGHCQKNTLHLPEQCSHMHASNLLGSGNHSQMK